MVVVTQLTTVTGKLWTRKLKFEHSEYNRNALIDDEIRGGYL